MEKVLPAMMELPQVQKVDPNARSKASDRDPIPKMEHENKYGQTHLSEMERLMLLYNRISELEARQREMNSPEGEMQDPSPRRRPRCGA
jgi:hypothetical protein